MRVIECDMSNYFVVRDPGSWHCAMSELTLQLDDTKLAAD